MTSGLEGAALAARESAKGGGQVGGMVRIAYAHAMRHLGALRTDAGLVQDAMDYARQAFGVARWPNGAGEVDAALRACVMRERHKREVRRTNHDEPVPEVFRVRYSARVVAAAREAYDLCDYRHASNKWGAGGLHDVFIVVGPSASCKGASRRVWSDNRKWSGNNSSHEIIVPITWLRAVKRAGGPTVEVRGGQRCLVLDANRYGITYAAQGRGFNLELRTLERKDHR